MSNQDNCTAAAAIFQTEPVYSRFEHMHTARNAGKRKNTVYKKTSAEKCENLVKSTVDDDHLCRYDAVTARKSQTSLNNS